MLTITVILIMLLAVAASGYIARSLPISLPLPLVQISLGALIVLITKQGITLEPHIFFLLFLPPLLFLDGWRIPKQGLLHDKGIILELAFGLVVFTVVGMGFFIHWMIPSIPLAVAFALAAIISPTDPVAVSAIAARVPIPSRIMHILEGESLLNDASGLVCFRFAVAAAMTGVFSLGQASLTFLWVAIGGVAIGVGVTVAINVSKTWLSLRLGEDAGSQILISLLTPFGSYLLAEHFQMSGILAAVAAGMAMSYAELRGTTLATTRVQRTAVWDTVQFTLNGLMFVLLGEQLPGIVQSAMVAVVESGGHDAWMLLLYTVAINVGLVVLRFFWVWVSLYRSALAAKRKGQPPLQVGWRLMAAISLAGVRGAITLAGVLTLPLVLVDGKPFPARDLVIFLATAVIILSLIAASIGLPRLLAGLELPPDSSAEQGGAWVRQQSAVVATKAIEAAYQNLDKDAADAEWYAEVVARVLSLYSGRLSNADEADGPEAAERVRRTDELERKLRLVGIKAEREALFDFARRGQLSDERARKLIRELDLMEERLQ